jgi:diguanylate cyclase (GGDEF)-like protein
VVTILHFRPVLYPLLFVPLIGVYLTGGQSVRTAAAEHLARHDSLTELPNRRRFMEAVSAELENPGLDAGGLLLVDLNGFKDVNDTLGHHHGDLVLQELGPRLRGAFRGEDLVARLGGDEFAVFMPDADTSTAQAAVERPQDALQKPVEVDGISIALDASIGLAWYPDHGTDVDTLLQRADVAMYRAKAGNHALVIYRSEDDYHSPERLGLAADLRRAVAGEQLVLHYQPQVELGHGTPVAAEGLVRWHHPQRGLLGPLEFIEVAERAGVIKDLTHRVIDLGLRDLRAWTAQGRNLSLLLNISVRSLLDRRFPKEVERLRAVHGVDGHALTLELTESSLMVDPELAKQTMRRLAELGVSVAIDDFGTGYSSLAYLTDLPIGELKIDKSFVRAMSSDNRKCDRGAFDHRAGPHPWPAHGRRGDRGRVHGGLMLLGITALALVVSVPLAGGRLGRLVEIRVRGTWAVLLAVGVQVAITTAVPGGSHWLHAALHVASYGLDAYFVFVNRRLIGVPVVALGAALNLLAITANRGVMPASATALRISGVDPRAGFDNSAALAHPHLAFLGDIIPVPGPWPIGNVLSVGDLIIFIGALVVLHVACGSRLHPGRGSARISRRCARLDCRNLTRRRRQAPPTDLIRHRRQAPPTAYKCRSRRRRSWPAWPRSSS